MTKSSLTRQAVRLTLAAAAAAAYSAPVVAQDSAALGEVLVTGTRIVRQDYTASSPVVTVSSQNFELSGQTQIETVLNQLPQLVPSVTITSNNPSNGGQANTNLRGLGGRELVLMDGTPLQPSNVGGGVDLNTIPAALIESVEILTGGASAVYGSDAIAGVINFRMKRDFDGVQLTARSAITEESDGQTQAFDLTMGSDFADGRGNAVLAFSYDDRDAVYAGDRPFGTVSRGQALQPLGSGTGPEGRYDVSLANLPTQAAMNTVFARYGVPAGAVPRTVNLGFNPNGTLFNQAGGQNFLGDTSDPGYNPANITYNYGPVNYLQLPLERRQVAAFTRYEIVPDSVELYSRMMFTTYSATQELAPTPVTGLSVPMSNPLIPQDLRDVLASRIITATGAPGGAANFTFRRRIEEVGQRISDNAYNVFQGLVGVRGDIGATDWNFDIYGTWGQTRRTESQLGNVSRSRITTLLTNPVSPSFAACAASGGFNPFGRGRITPACATAIAIRTTNVTEVETTSLLASVSGDLFELPAGPVGAAFGASYGKNDANFRPDEFLASGDVVGFNAQQPVAGSIDVSEAFAEFAVPLLKELPAVHSLNLDLGYRYSEYNLAGEANTYKAGLNWRPIETFMVRASYNRAIRAPSVSELFSPTQENFPTYSDPCRVGSAQRAATNPDRLAVEALCVAQGIPQAALATFAQTNSQIRTFIGGNLNLTPEEADTYTYGIAWQPDLESDWVSGLRMSVDYWKFDIKEVISALLAGQVVARCFNSDNANPTYSNSNVYCQSFIRLASGEAWDVQAQNRNLAGLRTDGVDVQIDWRLPLTAFGASDAMGDLTFNVLAQFLNSRENLADAASSWLASDGTISSDLNWHYPEVKVFFATTWDVGDFTFRWKANYIDGMSVVNSDWSPAGTCVPPPTGLSPCGVRPYTPSYLYHDLTGVWKANDKLSITLGVNNVGDKQPPIFTTDSTAGVQSNTDPSTFDVLGRRYFATASYKF